jgi:oxygen-independent coproporphyrinogen-3 oxidase
VVVTKDRRRADEYIDHLARELEMVASHLGERRKLSQLHWGGGTPTFLDEAQIARLWGEIARRFTLLPDAEIAIEIDPVVTTKGQIELLRSLRFNRMSMGVQDFDPRVQNAINRVQSPAETHALLDYARGLGFRGINFDLIYGLPLQTPASWAQTLKNVVEMAPDRLAVYSFAFVPQARPHQKRLAVLGRAEGKDKLALYAAAYEAFTRAGYIPIGMDHFARADDELALAQKLQSVTRNFQGYSVKSATDVVAFGVTAIGDVSGAYFQNVAPIVKYYAAIECGRFATERGVVLSVDDQARRAIIRNLMCNFAVDLGARVGSYTKEVEALRPLEREGLLAIEGSKIELSDLGRMFVRNVAMVFDAYLGGGKNERAFSRTV